MAGTSGTAEIKTRYPIEDGLIAKTTTQEGHIENLIPEEKSLISPRDKI